MTNTYFLNESETAAATVDMGVVAIEKLRVVGGGCNIIHLSRDEALNLFAALGSILGRTNVGNYVPVWERTADAEVTA